LQLWSGLRDQPIAAGLSLPRLSQSETGAINSFSS